MMLMANYKRKKKRERKSGWSSESRLHSRKKIENFLDQQLEPPRNLTKRKKDKTIAILAKSKPGKPRWWNKIHPKNDWFVWKRYEKPKDAINAIKQLKKGFQSNFYEFIIDVGE